jgi:hypothetical protein
MTEISSIDAYDNFIRDFPSNFKEVPSFETDLSILSIPAMKLLLAETARVMSL